MRITKLIAVAAAGILALGTLAACTTTPPEVDESTPAVGDSTNITIGMANLSLGGDYFVGMDVAVKDAGQSLGWTVLSSNADGDAGKLLSDVQNFVTQGVDGIIISGGWLNDFAEALTAASDADIPVVLVDRLTESKNFTAWIGPENRRMGNDIGDFIVGQLPQGGVAVIIRGGPEDNTIGIARTAGVVSALDAAGNFDIQKAADFGQWNAADGKTAMENMLAKLTKIDVVFCENDDMCLGAQSAAKDAGRSAEMFFCGIDGSAAAKAEIATEGTNYLATGFNDPFVIGKEGVAVMNQILAGEKVDQEQPIDSPMITKENVAEYL
ncbi:MAG: substrate-binding domain-containing protein [Propionibacteriaceae bacterium]|nr:substrate-binding domain-containing protein [Propionibacteriaceae bacterium]